MCLPPLEITVASFEPPERDKKKKKSEKIVCVTIQTTNTGCPKWVITLQLCLSTELKHNFGESSHSQDRNMSKFTLRQKRVR